jgi:general secretion pathway protein A
LAFTRMKTPYLTHYGLVDEPYTPSPNPRYLYISPTHNLALQKIIWTVSAKRGLTICFGKAGTGKTTLARELVQRFNDEPDIQYVFITNPNFPTPNQLLRAITQEFGVPETSKNYLELLNIVKRYLATQAGVDGKTLVLVVDEAQALRAPLLEMVRQLMNYESNDEKFLQLVLFAQEEFRTKLQHPRYRNLVSRTAMASTLDVLSLEDSTAMLRHRWMVAGGKDFPFTDDAIEEIYVSSHGIPRTEVILADNALLGAFLGGQKTVDAVMVRDVIRDRGLPDAQPTLAPDAEPELTTRTTRRVAPRRRAS